MSFTDHKITQFAHRVADLPDEPQIPATELKSRFDACPEELRQSLNAVCDDAARLEARVEGIVVDTFGDTIDKEMLSDELAAELDAKAEAADLTALDARVDTLEDTLPEKCEMFYGSYTGTGQNGQMITLGFQPKAVLVIDPVTDTSTTERLNFCGLGILGNPASSHIVIQQTGFSISAIYGGNLCLNKSGHTYFYLAFC